MKFEITEQNALTILRVHQGVDILTIIPIYLRSQNWKSEFQNLKEYIYNNGSNDLIIMEMLI